jgi:N-acetylglucosaminyl-diphospho-decaprenol L-rhamnosyltransferase
MDEASTPDLSIIIVSWNVRELLRACLQSVLSSQLSALSPESVVPAKLKTENCELATELIVIDNASSDGSAAMVAAEFPAVRLIANTENFGFTRGNNQGLAVARGRHVFFLNPDTEVVGDALATMVAYLDAHPEVGALGPELRYGDGSLQSSRRRFPTFATALFESTPLAWHWPANPWARRYRMEDQGTGIRRQASGIRGQEPEVTPTVRRAGGQNEVAADWLTPIGQDVDWVVGAALAVRREVLARVGGFDEGYFMYSEELDLCRRIKEAGWQIVYLPTAQIIHYEGKSSEQVISARHIRFQTSKVRYFRKFHGPFQAEALRVFILASFAVEWLIEASKWLLGSQQPLRRERMVAYGQLLRSGLRATDHRPSTIGH